MASATLTQSVHQRAPDVVIGVDTHKDIHVAVALAPNGGRLGDFRIPTTRKGYDELMTWTEQFGYTPVFAVEGTGSFGAGLCRELVDADYEVVEVNRPDRSTRRRLGKNDAIDAEAAARAWIAGTATVTPKAGGERVEMIRMLKCAKDSATGSRTRAINQIKAILVTAPAALRERLEPLHRSALIRACSALRPGPLDAPLAAAKRALRPWLAGFWPWKWKSQGCGTTLISSPRLFVPLCARPLAWESTTPPLCSPRLGITRSACAATPVLQRSAALISYQQALVRPTDIA